jgi:cytochrome c oxidase cbb3-type subunit III
MNPWCRAFSWNVLWAPALLASVIPIIAQTPSSSTQAASTDNPSATSKSDSYPPSLSEGGGALFFQRCAFCHGRDAGGGETGPDLTRSKLVTEDVEGDKIKPVVLNGRSDKGMPRFNFSDPQLESLIAFIHTQRTKMLSQNGNPRGVDVADLQTGNIEEGKQYFNGAGTCSTCHSDTGDLAHVASRYQGLELEERILYPQGAKAEVTVTLPSGRQVTGKLEYQDEFTVGLRDESGTYRSWLVRNVNYSVDAPAEAHVALFSKYTDDDIYNLMAYLQTLR